MTGSRNSFQNSAVIFTIDGVVQSDIMPAEIVSVTENGPVQPGQALTADVEIKNLGALSNGTAVEMRIDGVKEDEVSISSLNPGQTTTTQLSWDTQSNDDGPHTAEFVTPFSSSSLGVSVESTTPVIDDFEDDDIAEYVGETDSAQTVSSPTESGSVALQMDGGTEIRSTTGLDRYPEAGDVFEFYTYLGPGTGGGVLYGIEDADNYNEVVIDSVADEVRLIERTDGTETVVDTASVTVETETYFRTEIEWRDNLRHLVSVYDSTGTEVATLDEFVDSALTGGFGWIALQDSTVTISDGEVTGTAYQPPLPDSTITLVDGAVTGETNSG